MYKKKKKTSTHTKICGQTVTHIHTKTHIYKIIEFGEMKTISIIIEVV